MTSRGKGGDHAPEPKKQKRSPRIENPKLTAQVRKVLGKHYANKYRTGRKGG